MSDVTRMLQRLEDGDTRVADRLLEQVYVELRKLAARRLAAERPGQTLEATGLVHEAYLRLVDRGRPVDWRGRGHFFGAAAEAMRRIMVERARRRWAARHRDEERRVQLEDVEDAEDERADELLTLNDALDKLAREEPDKAAVVKLRYFAGLSIADTAQALGISVSTAKRRWTYARAWLFGEVGGRGGPSDPGFPRNP